MKGICELLHISPQKTRLEVPYYYRPFSFSYLPQLSCFKALASQEKIKGVDNTPMVDISRLGTILSTSLCIIPYAGLVMQWFGPLRSADPKGGKPTTFLDRILAVMRHGWFFGDIDREESENLLRDLKKKPGICLSSLCVECLKSGTFLVRVNLGGSLEPSSSPFTISKVNKLCDFSFYSSSCLFQGKR